MVLINWEIQIWDNFEAYSRTGKALAGAEWGAGVEGIREESIRHRKEVGV